MSSGKSFSIGCGSSGPILSAAIILARAICGSAPMEEWSVLSWFLMTIPATIPLIAILVWILIFLIGCLVYGLRGESLAGLGRRAW